MNVIKKTWYWLAGLVVFVGGAYVISQRNRANSRASKAEATLVKYSQSEVASHVKKANAAAKVLNAEVEKAHVATEKAHQKVMALEAHQQDSLASKLDAWNKRLQPPSG